MANQQEHGPGRTPTPGDGAAPRTHDLLGSFSGPGGSGSAASSRTVLVALGANLLVAAAKSVAAVVTGSASVFAEAAHSWADTANEVFLLAANRRSRRPPDRAHPFGHGREAYVWALLAAVGLFVSGAAVSLVRGVHELVTPEPASHFAVGYAVLALSLALEAISFLRSVRQAKREARIMHHDLIEHVLATSDPTLRAVFAEDAAALSSVALATVALAIHQWSGSVLPDAIGSVLVGVLLAVVAVALIDRNRRFLVGQEADPRVRAAVLRRLLEDPEVARLTYLRVEIVGPRMISVVGEVDLAGDEPESHLATRLRALEGRIRRSRAVAGVVLSLSAPDEPTLLD